MPPKGRKRNRAGFRALRFQESLVLGALGNDLVISGDLLGNVTDKLYLISLDLVCALKNLTAGQGPIAVGIAHGDYSVTEILEWFQSTGMLGGDQISIERSRRKIRDIGIFNGLSSEESLNHGNKFRVRAKFVVEGAESVNLWALNLSDATLTTGAIVDAYGKAFVRML